MSDIIGRIAATVTNSGQTFPLTTQYPFGFSVERPVIVHRFGGIAAGIYPTPGNPNTTGGSGATYLSLNISGADAANFMTGQFVTPQFVTDQAMAAQYSSYGRTQQSANMQLPGLTVA
ncbi:MAG TPA: hypothetical protein VK335_02830 [Bryobacteraceae bacterium]|nr:hypothetical protein [Bryobacteraceae bacterium]